jgi:flagellar basal-body rod protein FlgB
VPTFRGTRPTVLIDTTQLALERALEGSSLRQQALASNLANVNTPGYRRSDVDFHSALAGAMRSGDAKTALSNVSIGASVDRTSVVRADGSSVDVDAESAKLAANGLEYEQLTSAARVRIEILRIAMGVA